MPRTRKVCPICTKKGLLKLSNHLTSVHKLSTQERQPYLIRAKKMPIDKSNGIDRVAKEK
jgi:hypothetical protein